MTNFDPKLAVLVSGNEVVVVFDRVDLYGDLLQGRGSQGLFAKNIANKNDPRIPMTAAEFLAKAWKAANHKAKELRWIP
jgi:hypothetical protein